ncbi:MAG TPA: alpha-ketoglutarate-dependent dioxygenase AlkB [Crocinitomicaceae bacterium]|nr:alpha-ketoglutarate-dependent dioxygenase AlkB [Flavobacteriales bacterium]HBW85731.1 alpha-ketoglutarate-dependent dioxygenase AlkB [Crocinitomicaceae bacterium]
MGRSCGVFDNGLFVMEKVINDTSGEVFLIRNFLHENESEHYFSGLMKALSFEQKDIVMFGKRIEIPRLESFHAVDGKSYGYSGKRLETRPFNPILSSLKGKIEGQISVHFNSVLVNLYRNENDSNGWHADDEKELGKNPVIASISIGAKRRFQLKHKLEPLKHNLELNNGDLLIMGGTLQSNWKHQVPKEKYFCGPRLNLTFRFIY